MIAFAIALLALAAGTHLLIQVKQAGLGFIYKALAWKVILISGLFMVGLVVVGVVHHHRHKNDCHMSGHCGMGHGDMGCPYMKGGASCCMHGGHGECTTGAGPGCCAKPGEGAMPACCDKEAKAPCCDKSTEKAMPACCAKGAKADSTAKK